MPPRRGINRRSGTKNNTGLVLTQQELDYINQHWQGRKSAAIHAALSLLMQQTEPESEALERVRASTISKEEFIRRLTTTQEPAPMRPEGTHDGSPRAHAKTRVLGNPALYRYHDTIFYDWPEGDEHWHWITTAPAEEIVAWAEAIEAQPTE